MVIALMHWVVAVSWVELVMIAPYRSTPRHVHMPLRRLRRLRMWNRVTTLVLSILLLSCASTATCSRNALGISGWCLRRRRPARLLFVFGGALVIVLVSFAGRVAGISRWLVSLRLLRGLLAKAARRVLVVFLAPLFLLLRDLRYVWEHFVRLLHLGTQDVLESVLRGLDYFDICKLVSRTSRHLVLFLFEYSAHQLSPVSLLCFVSLGSFRASVTASLHPESLGQKLHRLGIVGEHLLSLQLRHPFSDQLVDSHHRSWAELPLTLSWFDLVVATRVPV